jgi:hypothetical protein
VSTTPGLRMVAMQTVTRRGATGDPVVAGSGRLSSTVETSSMARS